jgi:lysophospholipase L1-like esterase
MSTSNQPLTLKLKFLLVVVMPLLMLLGMEVACRILNLPRLFTRGGEVAMDLEMPTWMMLDTNSKAKATRVSGDGRTIDWLNMFEEAPGFRVRLIPNIEKNISNTFSQIEADRNTKYLVRANSLGFRGPEISLEKPADTIRIGVFGDSSSFGWGVNQDETFSSLLQSLLSQKFPGRKFEVANFAIPGDSSEYGKLILEKFVPQYKMDMLILGFGANDAKAVRQPHSAQVDRFRSNYHLQLVKFWAEKSAIYRTIESLLKAAVPANSMAAQNPPSRLKPAVSRSRYRDNLAHMAGAGLEHGARQVAILTLCTPNNYSRIARTLATARGYQFLNGQARMIDLLPQIKAGTVHPELVEEMTRLYPQDLKRNELFYLTSDSCHPNKLGHRLVAESLLQLVVDSGLVE